MNQQSQLSLVEGFNILSWNGITSSVELIQPTDVIEFANLFLTIDDDDTHTDIKQQLDEVSIEWNSLTFDNNSDSF